MSNAKDARNDYIESLARDGIPYSHIAEHYGISASRVSQICRQRGYARRPFGCGGLPEYHARNARIAELYASGVSLSEIAKRFNLSRTRVHYIAQREQQKGG